MGNEQEHTQLAPKRRIALFRGARQAIAGALACAMLPLSLGTAAAQYQDAPPPPPDYNTAGEAPGGVAYQSLAPEQIDSLVAPIALYPDSLVAQVLAGATYPAQLASAEQFVQQNSGYPPEQLAELANTQPWDPSVKSLVAFPQVLNDLNRNMEWTTQLGNAYYNQPQDVLSAVQAMRQRAYAAGSLRTTPQLAVTYEPGDILIAPVSPAVVYVPYYDPWVVYGAPVPVYPHYYYGPPRGIGFGTGLAIGFGVGIAIGAFTHFSWGYHSWRPDWHERTVVYNQNTYISRSVTVVNHGNYGRFDRAPEARAFNQTQAARFGGNNRTINNVTINRGGNTYSGGNTINRGANTYNRGGNTINRGGQTYNNGANTYNRGGQPFNNGVNNRGQQPYNGAYRPAAPQNGYAGANRPAPPANTQQYGRPSYNGQASAPARPQGNVGYGNGGGRPEGNYGSPAAPARPQGNYGGFGNASARPEGNYGTQASPSRPQGGYNRGSGQAEARPAPQPQQRSAPQEFHGGGGGHESHDNHGGGGHEDHHH